MAAMAVQAGDGLSAWLIQHSAPWIGRHGPISAPPACPELLAVDMAAACLCLGDIRHSDHGESAGNPRASRKPPARRTTRGTRRSTPGRTRAARGEQTHKAGR